MNKLQILFENDEIRVINKPQGLAVQGGKDVKTSVDTELALQTGEKIYPVHRLDKETCGILVTAKNPQAATKWTNLIGSKQVKKQYFVQNVQALLPIDKNGKTVVHYTDTNLPAVIKTGKRSKIIVAGFPFESIIGDESRRYLMKLLLE